MNAMMGSNQNGSLSLKVVLKADDNDRSVDELHTTLKLDGDIEIKDDEYLTMGWAMQLKSVAEPWTYPWYNPELGPDKKPLGWEQIEYGEDEKIDDEGSKVK